MNLTAILSGQAPALYPESALSVLSIQGRDARDLLQRLTTQQLKHPPGKHFVDNLFPNENGRIITRAQFFLNVEEGAPCDWLVTPKSAAQTLIDWIEKMTFREEISVSILQDARVFSLLSPPAAPLMPHTASAHYEAIVHSQGSNSLTTRWPLGSLSRQLFVTRAAEALMTSLQAQITTLDDESYEWLRIAAGFPAQEHEITLERNPHEVGLTALVDWNKGCYIGQEVIARLDTYQKVQRRLVRLRLEKAAPVKSELLNDAGETVGFLSSVASPGHAPYPAAIGVIKIAHGSAAQFKTVNGEQAYNLDSHEAGGV